MKNTTRKILLSIAFFFCLINAKAQYVTIPDVNFVNWLNANGYASCMNGNQMDTTCNAVVNAQTLDCRNSNIYDLTGINYFHRLKILYCSENLISILPPLPDSITFLVCYQNQLTSLPPLPSMLYYLSCGYNQLTSLPSLPASLTYLNCTYNQINLLPALPDSLINLTCEINSLTSLPALPSSLKAIFCGTNQLSSLPNLNDSLINLTCNDNLLTSLPALPTSLSWLNCDHNQLAALPSLNDSLDYLSCRYNQLTSLPPLPTLLHSLNCSYNLLTALPSLPDSLKILYCSSNSLTTLPPLPVSLRTLDCSYNQLSSLPVLADSLTNFSCRQNILTSLPALPALLPTIDCSYNLLTSLPNLPSSLYYLDCYFNLLDSLPALPASLRFLNCYHNQLTSLPVLPPLLTRLNCFHNQLTSLPAIPTSISWLLCGINQLTSLPDLPDTIDIVHIEQNPNLYCLPPISRIDYFSWDSTGIACLPNVISVTAAFPPITGLPLCDLFNGNGCPAYWNISGSTYNDANSNCMLDINEPLQRNLKLNLYLNGNLLQQTFTNQIGQYSFDTDTGSYAVTVDTLGVPIVVDCPSSMFYSATVTSSNLFHYNNDFSVECKTGFDVGVSSIVRGFGTFRPGGYTYVNVLAGDKSNQFNFHCASGVSGTVTVIINGPANFNSITSGALTPVVNGNILTYTIPDFGAVNFQTDFSFIVQTDSSAQIANQVCFDVTVTPIAGDNNPSNNNYTQCFTVTNSFDPNEKEVYPSGSIDTSQHWLTYTIYFQNTGNDTALHIYILDTLDNDIDESSIQLLAYSHEPLVQVMGDVIKFNFPNINLPDSTTDEPHSHGYVQYRVRLDDGLLPGTVINNTAHIVFDFNAPVVTNTTFNQVDVITDLTPSPAILRETVTDIYPNPIVSGSELKLIFNAEKNTHAVLSIYDISGRKVFSKTILSSQQTQNVTLPILNIGIYEFVISFDKGIVHRKLMVREKR